MTDPVEIAQGLSEPLVLTVRFLATWNHDRDGALSAPEIGRVMHDRGVIRANAPSDWARPKLNRLRKLGLAAELGWTFSNARTWVLTPEGRAVAAFLQEQGEGA